MRKKKDKVDIRSLQIRMLITYAVVMFFAIQTVTNIVINMSKESLSNKVSSLVAANCRQIELNINNYFNNVESITTLLFADEKYYKYNPVVKEYDEYAQIKNEEEIADRIVDLGLMQNFTDFTVIYSDGNRVGWTSNTTAALYDKPELYDVLSNAINNPRTEDGWAFGIGDVTDRIFYVKRLNKNAILATAFYSRELETAFEYPEELEGMVINLIDENNTILYSSESDNIATKLNSEIADILSGNESDSYIANVNKCENGWSVVCAIPTSVILKETNTLKQRAMKYAIILTVIMLVVGVILLSSMFRPVDSAVEELKETAVTDKLSGLYNKQSFNAEVCKMLSSSDYLIPRAFVMIDVDNFKQINDNLGHAYGDDVIVRMGHLLTELFGSEYVVGRVGGDEFAIYTELANGTEEEETDIIVNQIKKLFDSFDKEFAVEKEKVNTSLSIGIAVLSKERRFDNLYKAADEALYISKKSGKNRYTIHEKKEDNAG